MQPLLKPWLTSGAFILSLLIVACATPPKNSRPPPIHSPVDAFEAVGAPRDVTGAPLSAVPDSGLSSDVRRLQNAHQVYQRAQQRQAAEVRRRQANCRTQPNSKQVAIQDGSGDTRATYCQRAPGAPSGDIR